MSNKVEITKIKLTIDGNTIEISAAAARKLRDELNGIFGNMEGLEKLYRKIVPKEHIYIPYPVTITPTMPNIPQWRENEPYCGPTVWCQTSVGGGNFHNIEPYIVSKEIR